MISNHRACAYSVAVSVIAPTLGGAIIAAPADASEILDAYTWVKEYNGKLPRGAPAMGKDIDGTALYPCTATFQGNEYAGKFAGTFKRCNIAVNGKELGREEYSIPMQGRDGRLHWRSPRDQGFEWRRSIGVRNGGQLSHLCVAAYRGSWQLGGTTDRDQKCRFSFGGGVVEEASFQVLMRGDK